MASSSGQELAHMPAELHDQPPGCHFFVFGRSSNQTTFNQSSDVMCLGGGNGWMLVETMNAECKIFQVVVSLFLIGVMCALGLVGNVLSMITLQKDNMHTVTTFLMSALCVADIGFILPALVVIMLPTYCEYFQHCTLDLTFVERFGWAVVSFAHTCTVYMTVLVALHRYFFVCRPHDCHRLSGLARARRQAILIPIGSLFFNLPRLFEYHVRQVRMRDFTTNYTFVEMSKTLTSFGDNPWYQMLYKNVLFCVLMFGIPLTLLTVLSVRLLRSLYKRRMGLMKKKTDIGRESSERRLKRRDDNVTFVLVIIIAVFVVCQAPMLAQRLLLATSTVDDAHRCGHAYFYVEQAANFFAVFNSCINFAIYFLFAGRFRQTLLGEVLKCPVRVEALGMHEIKQGDDSLRTTNRRSGDDSKYQCIDTSMTTQAVDTNTAPLVEPLLENKATSTEGLDSLGN